MIETNSWLYSTTKRLGIAIVLTYSIASTPIILKSYCHQKVEEAIQLQEKYIHGLKKSISVRQPLWCIDEKIEFQHWCEDNKKDYTFGKYVYDPFEDIEKWCMDAERNKEYYQEQLDHFFKRLDADRELRLSLEQQIYSSEYEIGVDLLKKSNDEYELYSYHDPSDPMYNAYLEEMRNDPQLQQLLWNVVDGEEKDIPAFVERAEQLVNYFVPFDRLEQNVLNAIEEKLTSKEMYEDLIQAAQSNENHHKFISSLDSLMERQTKMIEKYQEALPQLSAVIREEELSLLRQLQKDYGQLLQERHDSEERWNKLNEEYTTDFWTNLKAELIRDRIHQTVPNKEFLSPSLLAFGHTHPNFYMQEEEGEEHGPSQTDIRTIDDRPELIFTTLPDRWQIHTVVCGEAAFVREYPRTLPKP
ncbi:MAG: hypothetical protein Q7K45_06615 [Nanoarchaeota archaeon]|nr:hypothetical protein [Nanoarchaeota archaeon]